MTSNKEKFLVIFACVLVIPLAILEFISLSNYGKNKNTLADGFTISAYNVILDVKEDNKIDVTEEITVNWFETSHHGIYKFTPEWLQYTGLDNKTIRRRSVVLDYRAEGDNYSKDIVKKKPRIKIGDPKNYVALGDKKYVIKYTYDMGSDPYKKFDELIYHAYGDYWGTEIKNATIEVNMPKSIEEYNVNFFKDKFRKNNVTDVVDYEVVGNKLTAKFNAEKDYQKQFEEYCKEVTENGENCDEAKFKSQYKPLNKSLTVDIELPNGYFKEGSWNYGNKSFIIILIIFGITLITLYKWLRYGKDHKKRAETIEFYPPENLTSAEIGYISGNENKKKLTIALIVQLAGKGYIRIDEEKNKTLVITKLFEKDGKTKIDLSKLLPREITVKQLKEIDDNLSQEEQVIMISLFEKSSVKTIKSNIEKFLSMKDKLVNEGYIEVLDSGEKEIVNTDIFEVKPLTKLETIVYDRLFKSGNEVVLKNHDTFYKAFDEVYEEVTTSFEHRVHDNKSNIQTVLSVFRVLLVAILFSASYFYVEDLDPNYLYLYSLSFMCIFINILFTLFMKRKTEYGEEIAARVNGFKKFLETAEKKKLEELVSTDPQYFYNILPYTYVLGVSKKWIKKFEDIPIPEMNLGSFDYSSDYAYRVLYDVIPPERSELGTRGITSGCSSCGGGGGGIFGGGGGCSSCGGGGSW